MNIYSLQGKIVVTALILLLLFTQAEYKISAQKESSEFKLLWVQYGPEGMTISTCNSETVVYTVGLSGKWVMGVYRTDKSIIEARDANTGELLYSWQSTYGRNIWLYDCIVLGDNLYVVGGNDSPGNLEWLILKFTLDLKLVKEIHYNPSSYDEIATTIATDGKYLYVGGFDASPESISYDDTQWHVIKIDPNDLTIIKSYTYNPSNLRDYITSIVINPIDGKIWLIGVIHQYLEGYGKISILNQDLSLINSMELNAKVLFPHLALDETSHAYITNVYSDENINFGLMKISSDLKIVNVNYNIKAERILYSNGYLYLASIKEVDRYKRHVLIRATKELNIVDGLVLNKQVNATSHFYPPGKMSITGNKVYLAGYIEGAPYGYKWVIYAVSIPVQQETTAYNYLILVTAITTIATMAIAILFILRRIISLRQNQNK
jgi:predicted esterase YcpF (UPF0227 family)